jgi:phospho-N-acetylmuramoyl-pentapeptide-transferase
VKKRFAIEYSISLIAIVIAYNIMDLNTEVKFILPYLSIDLQLLYFPFVATVIVGSANAVNLTDGLDGLLTIPVITTLLVFIVICFFEIDISHLKYKDINSTIINMVIMIGLLLSFLWYNCYPAQIFIGDVGSLAVGSMIGIIAVLLKFEILLVIVGCLFVMEALSVMIQVFVFKRKKKRVFLMAPIHHHFEQLGWHETKVTHRLWIISIISAIIGLYLIL